MGEGGGGGGKGVKQAGRGKTQTGGQMEGGRRGGRA